MPREEESSRSQDASAHESSSRSKDRSVSRKGDSSRRGQDSRTRERRDKERDREHDKDRDRDRNKDRDKKRDRDRERDRNRDRDRDKDREHREHRDRNRDRDRHKSSSKSRHYDEKDKDIGPEKFAAKVGRSMASSRSDSSRTGSRGDGSGKDRTREDGSSTSRSRDGRSREGGSHRSREEGRSREGGSSARSRSAVDPPLSRSVSDQSADGDSKSHSGSSSRSRRKASGTDSQQNTPRTEGRQVSKDKKDQGERPPRIRYENAPRGVNGGKREISHASLGKLVARLTDAHQYDTEFRDVFLLTYRCFCSPYDFVKKLIKRYTAVLTVAGGLEKIVPLEIEDLDDRDSTSTTLSTAKSDINTGTEANVSIMRLLSVLKFWVKESGFLEQDLQDDRRAQNKLMSFLAEIQSTSPVNSIRQHAENMLLSVAELIRSNGHDSRDRSRSGADSALAPSSRLKLTRSSSDSKHAEKTSARTKQPSSARQTADDSSDQLRSHKLSSSAVSSAPKMSRGVTTGSADARDASKSAIDDSLSDSVQRVQLKRDASGNYDNTEPLTGLSPQDAADQLTLIEAELYFSQVNPRELTNKAWTRETKHTEAPNVMALIELFDATAEWVSSEILHSKLQAVERAKLINFFIDAADYCYQMNNFNTLFEITTGLSAPCIRQLNTTWGLVTAAAHEKFQCLQQACSPEDNYRSYRQAYALAEGLPRIPCWFILVKDLFSLEEAMESTDEELINWQKFRKIHKVISEALHYQNFNYIPADAVATGVQRKGKNPLRHDKKLQVLIRHRLESIRKDSSVLYRLARSANAQESIIFVNSLSEAGFL